MQSLLAFVKGSPAVCMAMAVVVSVAIRPAAVIGNPPWLYWAIGLVLSIHAWPVAMNPCP